MTTLVRDSSNADFLDIEGPIIRGSQTQLEDFARVVSVCQPSKSLTLDKSSSVLTASKSRRGKREKRLAANVRVTGFQIEYTCGGLIPADFRPAAGSPLILDYMQTIKFDKVGPADCKANALNPYETP